MDTSGAGVWGSFRDHRWGGRVHNAEHPEILALLVPQWESKVPSCLPLPLTSIFVNNKSICTGSGMSTWTHMDQRWFI